MNIYDQLQAVEDRYEELGELLSDPEVVSDTKRFMELSREEANTRETVTAYREYKQVIQSISDAEEMIKEASGDPDLEEMAKEELKESKAAKEEYEERLKILLLPKDPNDDKNIILEIRGAAGGDEAALFAGDLLAMYQIVLPGVARARRPQASAVNTAPGHRMQTRVRTAGLQDALSGCSPGRLPCERAVSGSVGLAHMTPRISVTKTRVSPPRMPACGTPRSP